MSDGQVSKNIRLALSPERMSRSEGGSGYAVRLAAERDIYEDCLNVHNLPDIFHYWSNRHVRPRLEALGFSTPSGMFRKYVEERLESSAGAPARFLSIGSGNCDLEIGLASGLRSAGKANLTIDCLDVNAAMLERGRENAAAQGVAEQLRFVPADLNAWDPADEYDAVIANQTLHHVLELEKLLDKVQLCLKPQGYFIVSDIIGRNGHERWPEALEIVHEYWRKLPPSYRYNQILYRYEELYQNWDCSSVGFEGIRSEDILPLLVEHFQFKLFYAFGNVIDPFVDRAFGPNFDAGAAWDQDFIHEVHERDEQEIVSGRIKPTHLLAVMSRQAVRNMVFHEPLTPRFCIRDASRVPAARSGGSPDPAPASAYEWHSWPHDPQRELEIACERLVRAQEEVKTQTEWALRVDQELEERTEWGLQLDKQVEEWTAWGLKLQKMVEERTAWAWQLDKELQEKTAHTLHLGKELEEVNRLMEERTGWALRLQQETEDLAKQRLQLSQELERLAWARPIDKFFHVPLNLAYRAARWVRDRVRQER